MLTIRGSGFATFIARHTFVSCVNWNTRVCACQYMYALEHIVSVNAFQCVQCVCFGCDLSEVYEIEMYRLEKLFRADFVLYRCIKVLSAKDGSAHVYCFKLWPLFIL